MISLEIEYDNHLRIFNLEKVKRVSHNMEEQKTIVVYDQYDVITLDDEGAYYYNLFKTIMNTHEVTV